MRYLFFIFLALVAPQPSFADIFANRNHKVGVVLDYWHYEEPGLMEDVGGLFGAEYEFKKTPYDFLYYQINAEFQLGRTQYIGQDLATRSPLEFDQTNGVVMLQTYVGVLLHAASLNTHFIPKIGLLIRGLRDFDDEFTGDYQRDQNYTVVPVGGDIVIQLRNGHLVTLGGWLSAHFKGRNKTYLTDIGGSSDLSFAQDKGSGAEISLSYSNDTSYASLVYRTWDVEDSESKTALVPRISPHPLNFYEPKNQTTALGFRFGLLF